MSQSEAPRILAVIPAREGSKGIPRKNMRLLSGKPLIEYALQNALASGLVTDIVVTTDSEEIISYVSHRKGVVTLQRSAELADDMTTLDPVVYDALCKMEASTGRTYDIIVTLQATSPLLKPETLDAALARFLESDANTIISVLDDPHLSWHRDSDGLIVPSYSKRVNRQELSSQYIETGAFLITDRDSICCTTRIGKKVDVYEIPRSESVDIDTVDDWIVCESSLSRKRIVFRADGYRQLGMGHIYRVLTLAYNLTGHDVLFVCNERHRDGIELLRGVNMQVVEVKGDKDFIDWLMTQDVPVDIVVCDQLNTDRDYIEAVKAQVKRVVCFEDLGSGSRHADAVVNALYEAVGHPHSNYFSGEEYACLRDEFLISIPKEFCEEVRRVFVMFGGSDPLDLTSRIYGMAKKLNKSGIQYRFDFVLGLSYANDFIVDLPDQGISVHKDAKRVSDIMREADLAFSSQGRSTFELASLGIPTIVLAENERETTHRFAEMPNGFINLGMGVDVSDEDILRTFEWLVNSPNIRREMRGNMMKKDLKLGIKRVTKIILGDYIQG